HLPEMMSLFIGTSWFGERGSLLAARMVGLVFNPGGRRVKPALHMRRSDAPERERAGSLRPRSHNAAPQAQQSPSRQSVAVSSTASPADCMSLPAPATVWQAAKPRENSDSSIRVVKRFIGFLLVGDVPVGQGPRSAAVAASLRGVS